jgi:ABC-type multidrug transport system ATPase subunit
MPDASLQPALRLRGLVKAFPGPFGVGRREVLHGIDLDLERGAMLGLVGPNGSGKTTLLRAIAGLERTQGGTLSVLGGLPSESAVRRRLGFLSEVSPFPPELSARAALDLLASLQGIAKAERRRRVAAWLERVGLAQAAGRPLGRFSKGMLRRFGLAQALLHEPDLVLLDEPTAGLDALGVGLLGELCDEALARGAAIVLASHLLGDVFDRAAELCVLIDGRVAAHGAPAELVEQAGNARHVRLELEDAAPELVERVLALCAASGVRVTYRGPGAGALLSLYRASTSGPPSERA